MKADDYQDRGHTRCASLQHRPNCVVRMDLRQGLAICSERSHAETVREPRYRPTGRERRASLETYPESWTKAQRVAAFEWELFEQYRFNKNLDEAKRRLLECPDGWHLSRWRAILVPYERARLYTYAEDHGFPVMAPPHILREGMAFAAFDAMEDNWRPFFFRKRGPILPRGMQSGACAGSLLPVPLTLEEVRKVLARCGPGDICWPTKLSPGNSTSTK